VAVHGLKLPEFMMYLPLAKPNISCSQLLELMNIFITDVLLCIYISVFRLSDLGPEPSVSEGLLATVSACLFFHGQPAPS